MSFFWRGEQEGLVSVGRTADFGEERHTRHLHSPPIPFCILWRGRALRLYFAAGVVRLDPSGIHPVLIGDGPIFRPEHLVWSKRSRWTSRRAPRRAPVPSRSFSAAGRTDGAGETGGSRAWIAVFACCRSAEEKRGTSVSGKHSGQARSILTQDNGRRTQAHGLPAEW